MAKSEKSNLSILIVSILLVVILFRLFYIQIINGDEYRKISSNNFLISLPILLALAIIAPSGYLFILKSNTDPSII